MSALLAPPAPVLRVPGPDAASLFVQLFALVTPLFFQVVVDKVLAHKSTATLTVVAAGLAGLGLFNVVLQYLRSYALSHTTNRIDVEMTWSSSCLGSGP